MALSGKISKNIDSKYEMWIDWTVNSQSAASKTSNITIVYKLQRYDGYGGAYNLNAVNPVKLIVGNETKVSKNVGFDCRNGKISTLTSWTGNVSHNTDGTLSLYLFGEFEPKGSSIFSIGKESVSGYANITALKLNPTAPIVFTAKEGTESENYHRGTASLSWSGASGTITGYKIERAITGRNDSIYGAWEVIKTVTSSATSGSTTDTVPTSYMSGTKFKYRIAALNGALASSAKESNTLTVMGGTKVEVNNLVVNGTIFIDPGRNKKWIMAKYSYEKSGNWHENESV